MLMAVHLVQLRLRDFRNYTRLDTTFAPRFHLFLGNNAQGKTNILESDLFDRHLAFLSWGWGRANDPPRSKRLFCWRLGYCPRRSTREDQNVLVFGFSRKLTVNNQPIRKLGEYFRHVTRGTGFCTEDLQLIKGTSRLRRRFMDLLLAQAHPIYLPLLQRYAATLRSRNARLLKQRQTDELPAGELFPRISRAGQSIDDVSAGAAAADYSVGPGVLRANCRDSGRTGIGISTVSPGRFRA